MRLLTLRCQVVLPYLAWQAMTMQANLRCLCDNVKNKTKQNNLKKWWQEKTVLDHPWLKQSLD